MLSYIGRKRAWGAVVTAGLVASLVLPTTAIASTGTPDKTETVYVQTDASGLVSEVKADVLLSNNAQTDTLTDRTRLGDIEPQDEDQTFTLAQDGSLVWTTGGKQVSYRGTSSERPPVDVLMSYTLDGTRVTPEELAGASGHLVMRMDYANSSSSHQTVAGKERVVSTPFVCVSLVSFDADLAKNVKVTNGSIMEDKGGCAVVGYAVPGLERSLGSDIEGLDLDLPTYVEIEADVTDFALDPVRTFVTAELFEDLDASKLKENGTDGSASALTDAMDQIISGSGSLSDALGQIAKGSSALNGGATALKVALGILPSGLSELSTGANTLSEKLAEASAVAGEMSRGATGLSDAAALSLQGLDGAAASVGQATSSVAGLQETVDSLKLDDVSADVAAAAESAGEARDALATACDALDQAGQAAGEQKAQVVEGLQAANTVLGALLEDESLELTDEQRAALGSARDQVDASLADLEAMDLSTHEAMQEAQTTLSESAEDLATQAKDIDEVSVDLSSVSTKSQEALASLDIAAQAIEGSQGGVAAVAEGTKGLATGLSGMSEGLTAAHDGASQLAGGIEAVATKAPAAVQGIGELQSGIDKLANGATAAAQGSTTLTSALSTFKNEGITKVVDALAELDDSLDDVSGSIEALGDAATQYDTFSGKADGQTGSVRFIYQTESIGK
ncbi:MAG: hypothetical protein IJ092_14930 [Atopobiaceae bacterium]|nr:hypothetical protein [Atopobiaceae bacterium]